MNKALKTLLRVRAAEKKAAKQRFAEAERERIAQEERIGSIQGQILASHGGDPGLGGAADAHDLATAQAFRLRRQVQLKREYMELHSREANSEQKRVALRGASQQERVVELALEKREEEARMELRRKEGRALDALASTMWQRQQDA